MHLPIALTTYERPFYFEQTMNSLERSTANLDNFAIFDDCSRDKKKKKLLRNTPHAVYIETENKGTVLTTIRAIEHMYNNSDCEYMVLLQDDILLSKSWLDRGIEIFKNIQDKNFRISYLSLYNRDRRCDKKYYIYRQGHPGLVGWIINRQWWKLYREIYPLNDYVLEFFKGNDRLFKCRCGEMCSIEKGLICSKCGKDYSKEHRIRNVVDYKLSLRVYVMKWQIAKVGKSLIQHVGDKSSMLKGKDMTYCRSKNFVGENK